MFQPTPDIKTPQTRVVNPQLVFAGGQAAGRAIKSLSDINQRQHEKDQLATEVAAKERMQSRALTADAISQSTGLLAQGLENRAQRDWSSEESEKDRTWRAKQDRESRTYLEEQQERQRRLNDYQTDWDRRRGEDPEVLGLIGTDYGVTRSNLDALRTYGGILGSELHQEQFFHGVDETELSEYLAGEATRRLGQPVRPDQIQEFWKRADRGYAQRTMGPTAPGPEMGPQAPGREQGGPPQTQMPQGPQPQMQAPPRYPQPQTGMLRNITGQRQPTRRNGPSKAYLKRMQSFKQAGDEWGQRGSFPEVNWEAYAADALAEGQGLPGILNRVSTSGTEPAQMLATWMGDMLEGFQTRPRSAQEIQNFLPTMEVAEPTMDALVGLRNHLAGEFDRRRVSGDEATQLNGAILKIDTAVENYQLTQGKAQAGPRRVSSALEQAHQLFSRTDVSPQEKLRALRNLEHQEMQRLESLVRFRQKHGPEYRHARLQVERMFDAKYQAAYARGDHDSILELDNQRFAELSKVRESYRKLLEAEMGPGMDHPIPSLMGGSGNVVEEGYEMGPEMGPEIPDDLWEE